ncbi:MAG: tetratricopeptide repeat protein [Ignavibacteria bacterium]|jgi:tetratricopeptide (TPR) repeat protein
MKFKPQYFYGVVAVAVIIILYIFSQTDNSDDISGLNTETNQSIPNDDIHRQQNRSETPGKENVSESFRHRMEMLKKEIDENPEDTLKLLEYANLLASAHMPKQSVEYYQKFLSINPKRTDVMFSLSFVYYTLGDYKNAEEQTNEILAIDPENTDAMYNLGAISASLGDKEKAKEIWQHLADKYPDKDVGIKASNSLKKL